MSSSHVLSLFSQLGEATGLPKLAPDDNGFCSLQIDDRLLINFMVNDDQSGLTLFSQLGVIDPESQPELVVEILGANLFWRNTGGNTLGLEPDSGAVVMMRQLPLPPLTYSELESTLQEFIATSERWFARIAETEGEESTEDSFNDLLTPGLRP